MQLDFLKGFVMHIYIQYILYFLEKINNTFLFPDYNLIFLNFNLIRCILVHDLINHEIILN